jgi:hypothetical protein
VSSQKGSINSDGVTMVDHFLKIDNQKWVPCPRLSWACGDFPHVFMPTTSVGMAPTEKLIGPDDLTSTIDNKRPHS